MKKNKILILADAFGYGPINTAIHLVTKMNKNKYEFIFIGPKLCIEKANKENVFDKLIAYDYDIKKFNKYKKYFLTADKIISVETTDILIFLINKYQLSNLYLIDNIFWMWDFIEKELINLKRYYISNVISCDKNINRIAKNMSNIIKVGSLRKIEKFIDNSKKNNLLISLGGAESYMYDSSLINNFYLKTVNFILKNSYIKNFKKVYIAGGNFIINYLKQNIKFDNNIVIDSFDNNLYRKIIKKSSYAIISPGLGNFNEIISTNIKVLFLLPINYSQYLQRLKFKKFNLDFFFQENNKCKKIKYYLEESLGIKLVLENLKKYDYKNFNKEIKKFFEYKEDNFDLRKKFYKNINKNGINEIIKDFERN